MSPALAASLADRLGLIPRDQPASLVWTAARDRGLLERLETGVEEPLEVTHGMKLQLELDKVLEGRAM